MAGALIAFSAGWFLVVWAVRVNRFASSAVRIQDDRGHRVIEAGPYALVRHPMYLAGPVVILTSGVALGSWPAAAIAAPGLPLLLWRTVREDRPLQAGLPGYRAYAARCLSNRSRHLVSLEHEAVLTFASVLARPAIR